MSVVSLYADNGPTETSGIPEERTILQLRVYDRAAGSVNS